MVKGRKTTEELNEFYPKVLFRPDAAPILITEGEPQLDEGEYLVEPTSEGFGEEGTQMVYSDSTGSVLISIRKQEVVVTAWESPNGSNGFNDYNSVWISPGEEVTTLIESVILDDSEYRVENYPFIIDFTDFIMAGPVIEVSSTELGVLKIFNDDTYEFMGFIPDNSVFSTSWSGHQDYLSSGSVSLRGAVIPFSSAEVGHAVYHIDVHTGTVTKTTIAEFEYQDNSTFYVDNRMYIFTDIVPESNGDVFVYELQADNTFSLVHRHPQPAGMVDTEVIHGGYGMSLSVKVHNDVIFVTDWGESGNVRVRGYDKDGKFLWTLDDVAGSGIFSGEDDVTPDSYIPTTVINPDTGNVVYITMVENATESVRLKYYEIDRSSGGLVSEHTLINNPGYGAFEPLGYIDGHLFLVFDWVYLYKIHVESGVSYVHETTEDIIYDSIYSVSKEGSLIYPNYSYGITIVPNGDIDKVIEFVSESIRSFSSSDGAYMPREGELIGISVYDGVKRFALD